MKILLVDDSLATRKLITKALRNYECEIVEAANGEEALEVAAVETPDLIVLDITMPKMDGVECLKRLKKDDEVKEIPVMMLTANSNPTYLDDILKLGAQDYVTKAQSPMLVVNKIVEILHLPEKP